MSESKKKRGLLRALSDAEESADSLKERAREVAEAANYSAGLARHLRPVIDAVEDDQALPADFWTDMTDAWESYTDQTQATVDLMGWASTSSATTASVTLTTFVNSPSLITHIGRKSRPVQELSSYLHRPSLIDEVRTALRDFDLDKESSGNRSAVDLLNEAADALSLPTANSAGATAVLLSARESILTAIANLLRRRPGQEPAKRNQEKVVSIGAQCGRDGLALTHFERLGRDLAILLDQLSAAKQAALDLPGVTRHFDEVLQFFKAFLASIDQSKLRPS